MKNNFASLAALVIMTILVTACGSFDSLTIPLTATPAFEDTYTIIWNGYSKVYSYKNGSWVRAEAYDYQFDVIQKRYRNQWKSVKSLHRIHPDYDGKAGDRDQTMYFELSYDSTANGIRSTILSSLGQGIGTTDKEFRTTEFTLEITGASFMPYNRIRINQNYQYETGLLTEVVELFKLEDGVEKPFMKNEEVAYFYIKGKLDHAPTKFESK